MSVKSILNCHQIFKASIMQPYMVKEKYTDAQEETAVTFREYF
ncbi:hypothetical protein [Liquorilactobacillus mali]|nr:hypothetical protein [Liquorilactobacillus mali]